MRTSARTPHTKHYNTHMNVSTCRWCLDCVRALVPVWSEQSRTWLALRGTFLPSLGGRTAHLQHSSQGRRRACLQSVMVIGGGSGGGGGDVIGALLIWLEEGRGGGGKKGGGRKRGGAGLYVCGVCLLLCMCVCFCVCGVWRERRKQESVWWLLYKTVQDGTNLLGGCGSYHPYGVCGQRVRQVNLTRIPYTDF